MWSAFCTACNRNSPPPPTQTHIPPSLSRPSLLPPFNTLMCPVQVPELRSIQLQDSGTLVCGAAVTLARLADTLEEGGKKVQVSTAGMVIRLLAWGCPFAHSGNVRTVQLPLSMLCVLSTLCYTCCACCVADVA